jgi:beta-glucanase (GH16 family)
MLQQFRNNKLTIIGILFLMLISCGGSSDNDDPIIIEPEEIIPTNLQVTITIVGADTNNPNGDGSGIIQCSATATNAVSYGYRFGNGNIIESTSGNLEYTYTNKGVNNEIVYVFAFSSTGNTISASKAIVIFVGDQLQLVFSDEFNVDGSPDSTKWGYDIGRGDNGWGNGEEQYYTNRTENVNVADGYLTITAKRENYEGAEFTSARMLTEGKFDFTYGKVEVRAKLPEGGGTWPAIWMLGSSIRTVGWPNCGEVDIMEHVGNNLGTVQSAIHSPSSYGNTSNVGSQVVENVTTQFHVYAVEWTENEMIFTVDDVEHYRYAPTTINSSTWPFNANQFIILNVAMGGGLGGTIDSNFTESSMIVDYVRVYQ